MVNGLALSPSADFCEERVRKEAISPAELVSVDVEGDGGGDCLMREARSTRRSRSLTTLRARSWSAGQSLVVRRRDGGGLSRGCARTYCCPTRGIVLGLSEVGMVGMKGVVGGSEGRRGE